MSESRTVPQTRFIGGANPAQNCEPGRFYDTRRYKTFITNTQTKSGRYEKIFRDRTRIREDEGSKLHIDEILNRTIRLLAYEVGASKHNAEQCLTIQYEIEEAASGEGGESKKEWIKHITFTGSKALINQLEGTVAEDFPVEAKIIKQPIGDGGRKHFYKFVDPE